MNKIVKIQGGLGNQLFQYGLMVALREHFHEKVLVDITWFDRVQMHQGFELEKFNVEFHCAKRYQVWLYALANHHVKLYNLFSRLGRKSPLVFEKHLGSNYSELFRPRRMAYYCGFWQHYELFDQYRDIMLRELKPRQSLDSRNQALLDNFAAADNVVGIHVRRGDYLDNSLLGGLAPRSYYQRAVAKIHEMIDGEVRFVIFSDDMEWCRANYRELGITGEPLFVDWNTGADSYKDMILMTACRANIIPNSTFSWWGCYLNSREDLIVIAPKKWYNNDCYVRISIPDWILLENEEKKCGD